MEKTNSITIAIYTAAAAALGNLIVSYVNGQNQLSVERIRAEQALVLEAIKTGGDTGKATENLRFLIKAGLLEERSAAIGAALDQGSQPGLPSAVPQQAASRSSDSKAPRKTMSECFLEVHLSLPGERFGSPVTRFAIKTFQRDQDLEITGLLDSATRARAAQICGIGSAI